MDMSLMDDPEEEAGGMLSGMAEAEAAGGGGGEGEGDGWKYLHGTTGTFRMRAEHELGTGAFATVFEAEEVGSGEHFAVKAMDRCVFEDDERKKLLLTRELSIASKLRHPNIINLQEVIVDDHYVMLVMELCTGGELYKLVSEGPMEEERARNFMKQIVSALMYCHENGVCHRDLKLENLMLVRPGEDIIKVTDFGLSKDLSQHSQPKTKVGTISYMAPEITQALHSSPYDGASADIWSIGVILYVMVCCAYPFGYDGPKSAGGESTHVVYKRIREGTFAEVPPTVSEECRHLIGGLLTVNVPDRATLEQVMAHPWLSTGEAYTPAAPMPVPASPRMQEILWPSRQAEASSLTEQLEFDRGDSLLLGASADDDGGYGFGAGLSFDGYDAGFDGSALVDGEEEPGLCELGGDGVGLDSPTLPSYSPR